jgi:predicted aminopeptidase
MNAHQSLQAIYQSTASDADKLQQKAAALQQLQTDYAALKADTTRSHWRNADGSVYTGYDRYVAQGLNNAHLAGIATYEDKVPAFVRLFEREGRDYAKFYERVKTLAALPKAARDAQLK